jgi:hypothetical protein
MRALGRLCVASCVPLLVACAAVLPAASAGDSATTAKSACAEAKAKLAKDEKHNASKARLKKDRKRVSKACKKHGGGTGGGGTGGGGTCTVVLAQWLGQGGTAYQVNFRCTAAVSAFTVTTNKTLDGPAFGRGNAPNIPFSCTASTHSFTCTGPSYRYSILETGFNSGDGCEPFTGTVTVNGKDYPFQGDCSGQPK